MPEKWDPYNISLTDDLIDLIRSWVQPFFEGLSDLLDRFLRWLAGSPEE